MKRRYSHFRASITPFKKLVANISLLAATLLYSGTSISSTVSLEEINALDVRFKKLSSEVYKHLITQQGIHHVSHVKPISNIKRLEQKVLRLTKKQDHITAISLIKASLPNIIDNVDDESVFIFLELLLKHNELKTAEVLYEQIKVRGDNFSAANASFLLAKHHTKRKQWKKTTTLLKGVYEDLPEDSGHYALIINGIALQHLKKHRAAIRYYEQVPEYSKYYTYAQLNIAIAYLRQGWWTDAQIAINQLLSNEVATKSDELTNRLYLVLGYLLLHKEYYRDSREAFRNISLDSRYINRALLGISLAAASQGDHVGALNTLSILKGKGTLDLSADEAHLLLPYMYEKLDQQMTASASYTETIDYYQKRIRDIDAILNAGASYSLDNLADGSDTTFIIEGNEIEFTDTYPMSFLNNMKELISFKNVMNNSKMRDKVILLYENYQMTLNKIIHDLLVERADILRSYLNQSRYGLAKLYDNSDIGGQ